MTSRLAVRFVFALALSISGLSVFTLAAQRSIGFELYSWKSGNGWHYAVLEGTAAARGTDVIRSKSHRLRTLTDLKGRLASLPTKDVLYWRRAPQRGFDLPPQELIREVRDYTEGLQLDLVLPGEKPHTDPIDNGLR